MLSDYQQQLRDRFLEAPVLQAPQPWQPVVDHRVPIGGLLGIGFASHPDNGRDLVMVVSHDGHGLFRRHHRQQDRPRPRSRPRHQYS